jgi:membrane fusion protein (multidrug efflux system)
MKNPNPKVKVSILSLAVVISISAFGCAKKKIEVAESIADIQKREGMPVTVITAAKIDLESIERSGGTVEGYQQAVLNAGIPATVSSFAVSVGSYVEKDAVIMNLTPSYASNYTIAKANAESIQKSQERAQALASQGGLPQEMLDLIQTGVVAAKEGLEAARKTENIVAPFSGTVVEVYSTLNSLVWPGKELVKISSMGRVRVKLNVSEAIVSRFAQGQKAIIRLESGDITGKVEKVSLAGDESNHVFTVEAVFDNASKKLRPGIYAAVDVIVAKRTGVIALPVETVIAEGTNKYVYVVDGGTAKKRDVKVGIRGGDYYEITSGLTENESVVASGSSLLSDGIKVRVVE